MPGRLGGGCAVAIECQQHAEFERGRGVAVRLRVPERPLGAEAVSLLSQHPPEPERCRAVVILR